MRKLSIIPVLIYTLLSCACTQAADPFVKEVLYVPEAVDYTDPTMWHIERNDSLGADVFYIPST